MTPRVELLNKGTPKIQDAKQAPERGFDGFIVAKWFLETGNWLIESFRTRHGAQCSYDYAMRDTDYGEVRLLWVSEDGSPPPEEPTEGVR